jgi:hypothetical protein
MAPALLVLPLFTQVRGINILGTSVNKDKKNKRTRPLRRFFAHSTLTAGTTS